jgi:hypothetical protein
MGMMLSASAAWGQGNGGEEARVTTVRGRVLNRVTKEPVGRALVTTAGDEYATMTDDRGQFELKIAEQGEKSPLPGNVIVSQLGAPKVFSARKPGFLPLKQPSLGKLAGDRQSEVTIYLVPEALIVGRVTAPGSEGLRIQCELFRLTTTEGKERWRSAGSFQAWENGEFRFSGLEAGTYRLITHELMDRDTVGLGPGAPLFGFPPVYYPNTTDFSAASPISVKAGEAAQANLTVTRRAYYPVRIPVANPPATPPVNVKVYPVGHWGPGWSLGYDVQTRAIEGVLPNGNYTVEADTYGEARSTGIVNLSVAGGAAQGPAMILVPDATISLNVREEFSARYPELGEQGLATYTANDKQYRANLQVVLTSVDESDPLGNMATAQPVEGTQGQTLTIPNVRPGRYRVNVMAFAGYAAKVESDGVDLLKQPLVVSLGGAVPPIEITLRDNGAEVSGMVDGVEGAEGNWQQGGQHPERYWTVLLVPIGRGPWLQSTRYQTLDGRFTMQSLAPGDYLVAAYNGAEENDSVPFEDGEFIKGLKGKAQSIHVEAGEKVTNLRVKVIAGSEEE